VALGFVPAACLKAQFGRLDGGMGGETSVETGGQSGIGGTPGTGGVSGVGGDTGGGAGGSDDAGAGGDAGTGSDGAGMAGNGSGGMGTGGAGTGGSGSGGMLDGGSDGPPAAGPGQLVITEIMADSEGPPDESGEWFEVYNPTNQTFDLNGCLLFDTSTAPGNTDTVGRRLLIGPGEYKTLARFGDLGGGFTPTYNYHTTLTVGGVPDPNRDVKFDNSGDRVGITCGNNLIDVVEFSTWVQPIAPATATVVVHGRTYSLDPAHLSATDNDMRDNWCTGVPVYPLPSGPDHGTPGVANPPCGCPTTLLSCAWTTP
jgi:hypothetical protein